MIRQNQCMSCTECVNIPEFRLKTSNIRIIEITLEEIPVQAESMDHPEIEGQPALQTVRNNQRRDIPMGQLPRRTINEVYELSQKVECHRTVKKF